MALLKIANLKKSYNITKTQKQDVLKGVNIEFKSGDLAALVGESGCGKSTLINILGGLDNDYTGSVVIKGDFIRDFNEKQMDDYRKKRVGLIFQNYNLIAHMTILQNVEIAMTVTDIDKKMREKRALSLLRLVGLDAYAQKFPNQLSGGQKQRVAIARALANNPTIILADEPTGALDAESAELVMKILQKIASRGKMVLVVTHSEKVAAACNRVVRMSEGVIVSDTENRKINVDKDRAREITPRSMQTGAILDLAVKNVKENKKRNALVSLGLAIGMTAVLLILCLSSGLTSYVKNIYAQSETSLQIVAMLTSEKDFSNSKINSVNALDGIKKVMQTYTCQDVSYSCGDSGKGTVNKIYTSASGFTPEILYGSFDEDGVVVNESFAAEAGNDSLIACVGETITFTYNGENRTYKITGVYKDNFSEADLPNVYMSENGMVALCGVDDAEDLSVNTLYITAEDITYVSAIVSDLESLSCKTEQQDTSSETVLDYIDLGTSVLTVVGMISMAVSAIMIFIVLYISVSERMKEIGILRAIGARKKDVRKMFVFEAAIIGLIGGIIAVIACVFLSVVINIICYYSLGSGMIAYNALYYLGGLAVSLLVSVLAGIAPAMRAAELDPVEALRAE